MHKPLNFMGRYVKNALVQVGMSGRLASAWVLGRVLRLARAARRLRRAAYTTIWPRPHGGLVVVSDYSKEKKRSRIAPAGCRRLRNSCPLTRTCHVYHTPHNGTTVLQ